MLFPDLAAEVDAALQRNGGGTGGAARFDAELDRAAALRFGDAGLGTLLDTPGGAQLARSFELARAAHEVEVPKPEAFAAEGIDLGALCELLSRDPALVAVPAPYGLGARGWSELFSSSDTAPSLVFATEVVREFAELDRAPVTAVAHGGVAWTVRLLPATPAPPVLGLNYASSRPHATLPELLMLQFMRVIVGEPLLDGGDGRSSFTWLAGELAGGRLAARHVFDAGEGAIRITAREVGSQGPHLGARQPVAPTPATVSAPAQGE